ncbi:unnamed protein product [Caenorhabditis sp. 36 PRJEB53466]|nr:unnamed protein product [Caenorhabditis sp. 36 PRJEB53466]
MSVTTLVEIPTLFQSLKVAKKVLDRVSIWNGDITKLEVDAIVNAANSSLRGGGGVDGAIHRAAGREKLQEECQRFGSCMVGDSVLTSGCNMKHIKNIIHTVGPQVYGHVKDSDREDLLSCYGTATHMALGLAHTTLAFCCISTGVYGYPNDDAAKTVTKFVTDFLETDDMMERIVLVTFLKVDNDLYHKYFAEYAESQSRKVEKRKSQEEEVEENDEGTEESSKKAKITE